MPQPSASHFIISAKMPKGVVQQTRKQPASAVVLARLWREAGYKDVEIIDPSGRVLTPEAYGDKMLREHERRLMRA